jgi:hypothetical protein
LRLLAAVAGLADNVRPIRSCSVREDRSALHV